MNLIVIETGRDGITTAMTVEETATGIAMMTGIAETMTEAVCHSVYFSNLLLSSTSIFYNSIFLQTSRL